MTQLRIFATARTAPRGPIRPMTEQDSIAWQRTRELHPEYYRKDEE